MSETTFLFFRNFFFFQLQPAFLKSVVYEYLKLKIFIKSYLFLKFKRLWANPLDPISFLLFLETGPSLCLGQRKWATVKVSGPNKSLLWQPLARSPIRSFSNPDLPKMRVASGCRLDVATFQYPCEGPWKLGASRLWGTCSVFRSTWSMAGGVRTQKIKKV